jgi:hypothetical protein
MWLTEPPGQDISTGRPFSVCANGSPTWGSLLFLLLKQDECTPVVQFSQHNCHLQVYVETTQDDTVKKVMWRLPVVRQSSKTHFKQIWARTYKHWITYTQCITLLQYLEKSYVNSTMGSYYPILKNWIKAQFITMSFFLQIIFYNTGLYSHIDKYTRICLATFEYIEADTEIYKKWITKSKEYSTTLHVWVSDYFTYSIIICRYL